MIEEIRVECMTDYIYLWGEREKANNQTWIYVNNLFFLLYFV